MKVIVPSIGRAGNSATVKWLKGTKRQVVFAVHGDETEAYAKSYPWAELLFVPEECRHHFGRLRKYLLDTIGEPHISCDDDVRISLKTVGTVDEVFTQLEDHIKGGATIASIGQQLFSNAAKTIPINNDPNAIRNKFASLVYAIDPAPFKEYDSLTTLRVYEDIAINIHAIQSGGGTVVSYCATHSNVSPPQGGCNSWRTREIILEDLHRICTMYPDICSIRNTDATTHSQFLGIGLRVAWGKIKRLS